MCKNIINYCFIFILIIAPILYNTALHADYNSLVYNSSDHANSTTAYSLYNVCPSNQSVTNCYLGC